MTSTEETRRLVAHAAALPTLSGRYDGLPAEPRLSDLPVLTKDDFRAALGDLLDRARSVHHGALVFGSGGTTSEPKLSLIPSGMFVADIIRHWRPLTTDDVLVNCNNGGELGSMFPFYTMLGHESGAVVVPLGAIAPEHLDVWLDFMDERGVTAIGATPSYVTHLLEHCAATGRKPPSFQKVVWTGEAFNDRAADLVRDLLPQAEFHGVYGSTETWVIGHNGPSCPLDVFHVLPYQHIEIADGAVLVTNTHPDCLNPIVRYRIGDRGELVSCPCGEPGPALRVLGRADQQVKFRSILFVPEEIGAVALADADVRDAQLVLFDASTPHERLELRLVLEPAVDEVEVGQRVRRAVVSEVYRIGFELADVPDAFTVRAVDRLRVNHRTNKTPLLIRDSS